MEYFGFLPPVLSMFRAGAMGDQEFEEQTVKIVWSRCVKRGGVSRFRRRGRDLDNRSRKTLFPVSLQQGQFCSEAFYCVLLLPSPGYRPAWADLGHSQPAQSILTGADVQVARNNN